MSRLPALPFEAMQLAQSVSARGWLSLRASGNANELSAEALSIARSLGEPVPGRGGMVESLKPTAHEDAHKHSLSAVHGRGAFPPHTDGAHLPCPPRFLLFACVDPGATNIPTTLVRFASLNLSERESAQCEQAVFLIRNGRRSFYSSVADQSRPYIRFDRGCMKPMDLAGEVTLTLVADRIQSLRPWLFEWRRGDILIVDNWRVLHGRGAGASLARADRHILRVSIQ